MWKNIIEESGRPHLAIWRTPKATNTHSEYAILTAFPLQQWLHERAPMLRLYIQYSASLVTDPTGFHFQGFQTTSSSTRLSQILKKRFDSSTSHVCCTSRPQNYPNNVTRPAILTGSGSDTQFGDQCHLQEVSASLNICPCKMASVVIYTILHKRLTLRNDGTGYGRGRIWQ